MKRLTPATCFDILGGIFVAWVIWSFVSLLAKRQDFEAQSRATCQYQLRGADWPCRHEAIDCDL